MLHQQRTRQAVQHGPNVGGGRDVGWRWQGEPIQRARKDNKMNSLTTQGPQPRPHLQVGECDAPRRCRPATQHHLHNACMCNPRKCKTMRRGKGEGGHKPAKVWPNLVANTRGCGVNVDVVAPRRGHGEDGDRKHVDDALRVVRVSCWESGFEVTLLFVYFSCNNNKHTRINRIAAPSPPSSFKVLTRHVHTIAQEPCAWDRCILFI